MSTKVSFSFRAPAPLKRDFILHYQSKGQGVGETLRAVMGHMLKNSNGSGSPDIEKHSPDKSRVRIEIRLTASEKVAVQRIADQSGTSASKWVSDLVRAYVTREPQFGMHELQVLGDSNSQLRAIGRNLNQIAFAMNRGDDHPDDVEKVVSKLSITIEDHTEKVYAIIRSNLERWMVTWR